MIVTPTPEPTATATAIATATATLVQVQGYGPDGISPGEVAIVGLLLFGFGLLVVLLTLMLFRRSL